MTGRIDTSGEDQAAALAAVRSDVGALRRALLGSERFPLENSIARLEQAAIAYRSAFSNARVSAKMLPQLQALRSELKMAGALARAGETLYSGMTGLLGAAAEGYTLRGEGVPIRPAGGLSIRG